jgi:hypothetical protein
VLVFFKKNNKNDVGGRGRLMESDDHSGLSMLPVFTMDITLLSFRPNTGMDRYGIKE